MSEFVSGRGDQRIVPYDPSWLVRAENLSVRLREALGSAAVRIEHIGSTSVPGLAARPIPDMQVSVRDVRDRDSFVPALESIGYTHFRFPELDIDDYLVFVPADGSNTEHVQICQVGSHQELRHLAVRDFLRSDPEECDAYARAKRKAAVAANGDRSVYSKGKDAFVHALEERALAWHAGTPRVTSDAPALDMSGVCTECGYDMTRLSNQAIVDLIEGFSLEEFLPLSRVRPAPEVWSPLEYAWHLRESFGFYRDRITLVLSVDTPQFEGGDFTVDPVETPDIASWLHHEAKAVGAMLRSLDDAQWKRCGIGSYDGGRRDVRNLASRLAHECVHHLMDIERPRHAGS